MTAGARACDTETAVPRTADVGDEHEEELHLALVLLRPHPPIDELRHVKHLRDGLQSLCALEHSQCFSMIRLRASAANDHCALRFEKPSSPPEDRQRTGGANVSGTRQGER